MTETSLHAGGTPDEQANTRRYIGVIAVEIVVLVAIWLFQRYFGS